MKEVTIYLRFPHNNKLLEILFEAGVPTCKCSPWFHVLSKVPVKAEDMEKALDDQLLSAIVGGDTVHSKDAHDDSRDQVVDATVRA